MRRKFILPIALCALLGAGIAGPVAANTTRYSNAIAVQAQPARVVQVAIDRTFTLYERAKIFRAVNEWNTVLNGQIRLEISPVDYDPSVAKAGGAPRKDGWTIAKIDSRDPMLDHPAMKRTLAVTVGTRSAVVYVVADRLGTRDLGGIMMHEFGHALGAGHDADSALMYPYYTGNKQRCIDKGAARAVAASQNLNLANLTWCAGDSTEVAQRQADAGHKSTSISTRLRR